MIIDHPWGPKYPQKTFKGDDILFQTAYHSILQFPLGSVNRFGEFQILEVWRKRRRRIKVHLRTHGSNILMDLVHMGPNPSPSDVGLHLPPSPPSPLGPPLKKNFFSLPFYFK